MKLIDIIRKRFTFNWLLQNNAAAVLAFLVELVREI